MSAILELAEQLRKCDDEELTHILRGKAINHGNLVDFFDLAEALLQPRNLDAWLCSLERPAIEFLATGEGTAPSGLLPFLRDRELIGKLTLDSASTAKITSKPNAVEALSGIHAFEANLAVTEFIFELEARMMREMGKAGIGLADVKRLASLTGKEFDYIRTMFDLTRGSGLITAIDDRWRLTTEAANWLALDQSRRWLELAKVWRELLGVYGIGSLLSALQDTMHLETSLRRVFPLEKFAEGNRLDRVIKFAEALGCTVDGYATSWLVHLINGQDHEVLLEIEKHLPKATNRIIVQADLSVIAPGPLKAEDERTLRLFVETEQSSIASAYRITPLSISHGLETGLSISEISLTLTRLSGMALPQPVDYLLADVAKRFGRIRVLEDQRLGGCLITSSEPTVLTELVNDVRLKPYALSRTDSDALISRFSAEVVYFGLREVGQVAVRVDHKGKVLPPRETISISAAELRSAAYEKVIARLRDTDAKISSSADDDSVSRQITLAMKTKAQLEITYLGQDEEEKVVRVEPIGLANGRLRARDRKADIERTIPIENIKAVRLL